MRAKLQFQDLQDMLLIRASWRPGRLFAAVSAAGTGGAVAVAVAVCAHLLHGLATTVLVAAPLFAAILGFILGRSERRADLLVTNLEYTSRVSGLLGFSSRTFCRADVRWLEYHEDEGLDSDHREGLYAVVGRDSAALLPYVDAEQVTTIIDRIAVEFPDIQDQWREESAFGNNITSLDLNREH